LSAARVREGLRRPFSSEGRADPLLLALFLLVNGIVLGNAIVYEPGLGYDAYMHERYVGVLARGRLPSRGTLASSSLPLPCPAGGG
jgi:hypothetical protein